ncbi:MAG: L-allo-threonine aldolase [Chloroflexi bacterium]|nr:L-allo-threonine aldolase [Chloroflexota bacterium]
MADINPLEIRSKCTRFLSGHYSRTQRQWLEQMAASPLAGDRLDVYSEGPAIQALEQEVAELLGKEAAVFMHKGVIAQQIALRVWADRTHHNTIALHPQSHIDLDEANAYERLTRLAGVRVGKDHRPFTAADLENLHEPLGAVTVELPLRRAGYKLVSWEELNAIAEWTRRQNVPLHFDGARLWESAPFYGRTYAEIAALADSVYVSFYKGLGGLGGCILAGPADFINEAKVWRTRFGGNLFTIFPYIISATEGLHAQLPKFAGFHARAGEIAKALGSLPGVVAVPDPPHTNGFQVYLPAEQAALQKAHLELAAREGTWLFGGFEETAVPGVTMAEIVVGDATIDWTTAEIVAAVGKLIELGNKA